MTNKPVQRCCNLGAHWSLGHDTYIDNRLFELDVQAVVGHGDDGVLCSPHILCELPVQLRKGHLATAGSKTSQKLQSHKDRISIFIAHRHTLSSAQLLHLKHVEQHHFKNSRNLCQLFGRCFFFLQEFRA